MSTIKVLDKAFQILNSFDDANKSISLKELTVITQLNKSTILRICNSLIKHNFLIKNEINGSYRLGPGSWKLGSIYNSNFKIGNEIKEILSEICEATGQSTGYWVKAGNKKVCLYRVNSKSELNHYVVEGTTFELKSATGKVLLAYTEDNPELKNQIDKKGYIFTAGERLDNIASVAVPVFDKKDNFKGTISVSGWKQFFTNKSVPKYYKILSSYRNKLKELLSNE
jgi:DNA-binding IclR family transcriptional regulator